MLADDCKCVIMALWNSTVVWTYPIQIHRLYVIRLHPCSHQVWSTGMWISIRYGYMINPIHSWYWLHSLLLPLLHLKNIQEPLRTVLVMSTYELAQILLALAINTDCYYATPLPRSCFKGIDDKYKLKVTTMMKSDRTFWCVWKYNAVTMF